MISTSATTASGFAALDNHMKVAEESAERFGMRPPRRADWRLVGPMHIAETREQAEKDVGYGMDEMVKQWLRVTEVWAAALGAPSRYRSDKTSIQMVSESGAGVVGTPDDAVQQILRLQEQSGGFGTYLMMGHEWANPEATRRSFELFAEYVIPEVNKANTAKIKSQQSFFDNLEAGKEAGAKAVKEAIVKYEIASAKT
jgi:limonene 1,2-monooxygenase